MKIVVLITIVVCGLAMRNGRQQQFEGSGSDNAILVAGVVCNKSVDQPCVGLGIAAKWLIELPSTEFPQTTSDEDCRGLKVMRDVLTRSSHPP